MTGAPGRPRRSGRVIVLVSLVAIATGLVLYGFVASRTAPRSAPVQAGPIPAPGSSIIANGTPSDLETAAKAVGFPLFRPQDPLANDASLAGVWYSPDPLQVGLKYESGLFVYLRPSELGDPSEFYRSQQDEGVPGVVTKINGATAFVVSGDPSRGRTSSIDMVLQGIEVAMVSHGDISDREMESIAASVGDRA